MKRFLAILALMFAASTSSAFAGYSTYDLIPGNAVSDTSTRAFGGLTWSLGAPAPEVVLGAFRTKVKPNGDTTGVNAAVHIAFWNGLGISKVKALYLNGSDDAQWTAGGGWDFNLNGPIATVGGNFSHFAGGVDVAFGEGFTFTPFVTAHTKGKFENKKSTAPQCVNQQDGAYTDPDCTQLDQQPQPTQQPDPQF